MLQRLWIDYLLASRNLIRTKRRSSLAILAVIIGITALIITNGFIQWIFQGMREGTIHSHYGHLQIAKPGYFEAGKADQFGYLTPDITPIIGDNNKIKAVVPRLSFSGLISHSEATLSFIGEGVDLKEAELFGDALLISAGQHLSTNLEDQLIMGEGLARNLGVNVNDQVVLLVKTSTGGINAIEIRVVGLFSTVTKSYDDSAIRIPIATARKLLKIHDSHTWIVLLHDTEETNQVLADLRNQLPRDNFEIMPWYELADFYNKTIALFTKQIQAIKVVIVLIILLSITNTLKISVMERIAEIGTAMALGVKRVGIMRLFMWEGILIGCWGGVLGLLFGLALASLISEIGIPMPPPPGMTRGYRGEILVSMPIAVEALVLVLISTLFASIYPAWKASRMLIVDALRHNR